MGTGWRRVWGQGGLLTETGGGLRHLEMLLGRAVVRECGRRPGYREGEGWGRRRAARVPICRGLRGGRCGAGSRAPSLPEPHWGPASSLPATPAPLLPTQATPRSVPVPLPGSYPRISSLFPRPAASPSSQLSPAGPAGAQPSRRCFRRLGPRPRPPAPAPSHEVHCYWLTSP